MSIKKSIEIWHESMHLSLLINHLKTSQSELVSHSQLKKTAALISYHIAEAIGKNTFESYEYNFSETNAFLNELQTQLNIAVETNILHPTDFMILFNASTTIQKNIVTMITIINERKNNHHIRVLRNPLNPNLNNDQFI